MELVHGTSKVSKSASKEDVISSMPDIVITNILDRLPVHEAVRTAILSRDWRFKWTMLSQLVFDEDFLFRFPYSYNENSYVGRNINRFLLHLKGSITKVFLRLLDDEDINHWFMFFSRKGVEDLTLIKTSVQPHKLPTHLFSCLELKHLKLVNCHVNPPPSFRGFPNLLSLDLNSVPWEHDNDNSVELITLLIGCPLLEILKLDHHLVKVLKLAHISKLGNLKVFSLALNDLDIDNTEIKSSVLFQLLDFLPKLEELNLDLHRSKLVVQSGASKCIPPAFTCLKTLRLIGIDFGCGIVLSSAFELIWAFPNLQTLELTVIVGLRSGFGSCRLLPPLPSPVLGSSDTRGQLEQLQRVVIRCFRGSDNEVCLIKYLLASTPLLKTMVLYANSSIGSYGELMVAKKLLKFHRASSIAEVELH